MWMRYAMHCSLSLTIIMMIVQVYVLCIPRHRIIIYFNLNVFVDFCRCSLLVACRSMVLVYGQRLHIALNSSAFHSHRFHFHFSACLRHLCRPFVVSVCLPAAHCRTDLLPSSAAIYSHLSLFLTSGPIVMDTMCVWHYVATVVVVVEKRFRRANSLLFFCSSTIRIIVSFCLIFHWALYLH